MRRRITLPAALLAAAICFFPADGRSGGKKDRVRYEKRYRDPVLKQMIAESDSLKAIADSLTAEIEKKYAEMEKEKREDRKVIRFDFSGVEKPGSLEEFKAPFHFSSVPQYLTGTCWCFCATSFLESEIKRTTGREVKLSELYTVYWEYVEKARGFIRKRGHQVFVQGAEPDGVLIIWDKYGVVPAEEYTGLKKYDKHNHNAMIGEIKDYLDLVAEKGYWDEEDNIVHVRAILDRYLGTPPEEFEFEGRMISPRQFVDEILKVDTSDYVQFISTLSAPFYAMTKFDVNDNWRPTSTYYNVPLEDFYRCLRDAARKGYTACIGGDVSEPGYYGFEDSAIIPTFDIPQEYIDQDSREFRIFTKTTNDDHGVHLLAHSKAGGKDWYLIKDSSRASRHGEHHGYLFFREDYIKLKMLFYMVHRDAAAELLDKIDRAEK